MNIPLYCVDAFTTEPFTGNPAAVCLLKGPATEGWMQKVAAEMNLAETAFLYPIGAAEYALRWFTPVVEVELCGHATLAAAHILYTDGHVEKNEPIRFKGRWHMLASGRTAEGYTLDFPLVETAPRDDIPEGLFEGLGIAPRPILTAGADRAFIELENAEAVLAVEPDFHTLKKVATRGVIITAKGEGEIDFVSRLFAPAVGIDEDPVTGSSHCALAHYWSRKLGKETLIARQLSRRGGGMTIDVRGDRVTLAGSAVTVWRGELLA